MSDDTGKQLLELLKKLVEQPDVHIKEELKKRSEDEGARTTLELVEWVEKNMAKGEEVKSLLVVGTAKAGDKTRVIQTVLGSMEDLANALLAMMKNDERVALPIILAVKKFMDTKMDDRDSLERLFKDVFN